MTEHATETKVLPLWRGALEDYIAAGLKAGDVLSHAELHARFGVPTEIEVLAQKHPTAADMKTALDKARFEYMTALDGFKSALQEDHQLILDNLVGEGYRVLPANEVLTHVVQVNAKRWRQEMLKGHAKLRDTRVDELTPYERSRHEEAQLRLQRLMQTTRSEVRTMQRSLRALPERGGEK